MKAYGELLDALGEPQRRLILERLRRGPRSVGEIAAGLPVSRPAVSQHLRVLEKAGLVAARRDGTRRIYRVQPRGLEQLRDYLESFWSDALAAFAEHADGRSRPKEERWSRPRSTRSARRSR